MLGTDQVYHGRFLLALLESQHEEKVGIISKLCRQFSANMC